MKKNILLSLLLIGNMSSIIANDEVIIEMPAQYEFLKKPKLKFVTVCMNGVAYWLQFNSYTYLADLTPAYKPNESRPMTCKEANIND